MAVLEKNNNRAFYEAGHYPNLSNEEYHGSFGYSSTTLKILSEKTKRHMDFLATVNQEEKSCFVKGRLLHSMVLEPHLVDSEFFVIPEGVSKPPGRILSANNPSADSQKKIRAWREFENECGNRTAVKSEDWRHCSTMAKSIREHPVMGRWFDGSIPGLAEQSIYYWYKSEDWDERNDYKTMLKCRPDWVLEGHPVIFDIKTTRDASFSAFMRDAKKLGYHVSAAMYLDGANRCQAFKKSCNVIAFTKFVWVVVESEPPYCATYYEVSEKDLQAGAEIYHRLVRRLDRYKRSDWQGYGEQDENGFITPEGRVSDLPGWGNNIV